MPRPQGTASAIPRYDSPGRSVHRPQQRSATRGKRVAHLRNPESWDGTVRQWLAREERDPQLTGQSYQGNVELEEAWRPRQIGPVYVVRTRASWNRAPPRALDRPLDRCQFWESKPLKWVRRRIRHSIQPPTSGAICNRTTISDAVIPRRRRS